MKCLVTGGAGFIGSNLTDKLIEMNHEVIVIDNESATENDNFYWNEKAENHKIDVCDYEKIEPLFKGVDWVFHLAAQSRIQPAIENPIKTVRINCEGTTNILQASRKHNVKKVMYSSTSAYYGLKNEPPQVETMERNCLNPYSVTKVAAEDLCKMYTDLYDLKTVIFRYFNVYGDRQPTRGQYAPVIGLFQRQKMNDEPMTIVGDGEQTRDYTNVLDVVNANIMAAESDNVGNAEVFNVGYGESHSILDLVDMIGGDYIHIPARKGEARHTQADTTNIKNKIGWKAQIMLKDYIYNWRKNGSN
tara:strand:+ start:51 stop:959 length:909 start_codon:yes stop_codon:yes gene_type:complete